MIVIDFDDVQLQSEFERQFGDLLKTRIVTSAGRGLAHYYYTVPSHISIPTKRINGADLLSNGCYVIAPPTIIADSEYKIQRGGMPYRLNDREARRLQTFFNDRCQSTDTVCAINNFTSVLEPDSVSTEASVSHKQPPSISPDSLVRLYQHYAPLIGRNNALFKVACHARDYHMSMEQVAETLQYVHAQQISYPLHKSESSKQRLQEARLTIKSVFRLPPQPLRHSEAVQLTNSIRESLLKRKLTGLARVLDGLFLKGFKSGDIVTKKMVLESLQDVVGKHSILSAFDAHVGDEPIFACVSVPPSPPPATHVAIGIATPTKTKRKFNTR